MCVTSLYTPWNANISIQILVTHYTSYSEDICYHLLFIFIVVLFQNEHLHKCILYIALSLHTLLDTQLETSAQPILTGFYQDNYKLEFMKETNWSPKSYLGSEIQLFSGGNTSRTFDPSFWATDGNPGNPQNHGLDQVLPPPPQSGIYKAK